MAGGPPLACGRHHHPRGHSARCRSAPQAAITNQSKLMVNKAKLVCESLPRRTLVGNGNSTKIQNCSFSMSMPSIPIWSRSRHVITDDMSSQILPLLFLLKFSLWIGNRGMRVEMKSVWEREKNILNKNVLFALLPILIATV